MGKNRIAMRREVEAAEAAEEDPKSAKKATKKKAAKKKAAKKKATRKSTKTVERRRLVWGIFSSTLKEEARFPYDQKDAAEEKLAALLAKGKRQYFLQPIKEALSSSPTPPPVPADEEEDEPVKVVSEDDVEEEIEEENLPSEEGDFSGVAEDDDGDS